MKEILRNVNKFTKTNTDLQRHWHAAFRQTDKQSERQKMCNACVYIKRNGNSKPNIINSLQKQTEINIEMHLLPYTLKQPFKAVDCGRLENEMQKGTNLNKKLTQGVKI